MAQIIMCNYNLTFQLTLCADNVPRAERYFPFFFRGSSTLDETIGRFASSVLGVLISSVLAQFSLERGQ